MRRAENRFIVRTPKEKETLMRKFMIPLSAVVALGACTAQNNPNSLLGRGDLSVYEPAVDLKSSRVPGTRNRPTPTQYGMDLNECRQIAYKHQQQSEQKVQSDVIAGALVGGLLGAVAANNTGEKNTAIKEGAALGALIGYDDDKLVSAPARVVDRCLAGRGYKVISEFEGL